jgi:hypothetical protein
MAEPNHLLADDHLSGQAPTVSGYTLTWDTPGRNGGMTYILDPSHPNHADMIRNMSLLERRILKVWLETVIESIDLAAWPPLND